MTKKQSRALVLITLLAISSAAILYLLVLFKDNIILYYNPSDFLLRELPHKNQNEIRVGGLVKDLKSSNENNQTRNSFKICDYTSCIHTVFIGTPPVLFKENQGVVAKGKMQNNIFEANLLMAKHDENYMPKEVVEKIKEQGQWQEPTNPEVK